jgi:acetyl-CoA acyltransferase
MTINRFCSSGLQAIATAANSIAVGQADIVAAGGTEVMSVMGQAGNPDAFCGWIKENDPGQYSPMWKTAEKVAREYGVTRAQMDEFALQSHKRAALATEKGYFEQQIVPVPGVDREGAQIIVKHDQGIRPDTSFEALSELVPAFDKEHGLVTAGQSSQLSDGSSFVILMSEERAAKMNIEPIAQMVGYAVTGTDPSVMGIGPITAIPKVLRMTGLKLDDIDVIELNEAFAAQAIPCISELGLDPERVNPNGGAIAMGHPTGATGAILTTKALAELARTGGRYAIVSMCVGGGMGVAGVWEMNR